MLSLAQYELFDLTRFSQFTVLVQSLKKPYDTFQFTEKNEGFLAGCKMKVFEFSAKIQGMPLENKQSKMHLRRFATVPLCPTHTEQKSRISFNKPEK